jgi:hypothetical protein
MICPGAGDRFSSTSAGKTETCRGPVLESGSVIASPWFPSVGQAFQPDKPDWLVRLESLTYAGKPLDNGSNDFSSRLEVISAWGVGRYNRHAPRAEKKERGCRPTFTDSGGYSTGHCQPISICSYRKASTSPFSVSPTARVSVPFTEKSTATIPGDFSESRACRPVSQTETEPYHARSAQPSRCQQARRASSRLRNAENREAALSLVEVQKFSSSGGRPSAFNRSDGVSDSWATTMQS